MKNRNILIILALCGTVAFTLSACSKTENTDTAVPTEETEEVIEEETEENSEEEPDTEAEDAVAEEPDDEDSKDTVAEESAKNNPKKGGSSSFFGGAGGSSIPGGGYTQDYGYDLDDYDYSDYDFGDYNPGDYDLSDYDLGDYDSDDFDIRDSLDQTGVEYEITEYENSDTRFKLEGYGTYERGEDTDPGNFSFDIEITRKKEEEDIPFDLGGDGYNFGSGPKSKAGLNNSMDLNNGKSVDSKELSSALNNIRNLFGNTTPDDSSVSDNSPKENDKEQNGTKLK